VAIIAIIDDNPDDLALLSRVLSEEGYPVVTHPAGSGLKRPSDVLDFIEEQRPDLIIVDPFGGGRDFDLRILWRIRHSVDTRYVPLIVCTAHSAELFFRKFTLGAINARILPKPFTPQELLEMVRASLTKAKP
jgi:CheY-like chemotaxis protein